MKKNKGKFDFKGDWAEGKTAEEYADDLRYVFFYKKSRNVVMEGLQGRNNPNFPLAALPFPFLVPLFPS